MHKKMCSYVILLIGLLIFSFGTAYAVPLVRLGVLGTPVQGTPFGIEVRVDGVDPLDPLTAFGFNTVTPASWSLIPNPTVALPFEDISLLFNGDPQVVGLAPIGSEPSGDDILLATLTYNSSVADTFVYSITSDTTTDANNDGIPDNPNQGLFFTLTVEDLTTSTNVTVNPIIVEKEPVPEPATILLVGFGLLALSLRLTVRKWYIKLIRR